MNRQARILSLAVTLALTGCAIGPDYRRPADLPTQEQYRSVLTPQEAASFADLAWAQTFNDPELRVVIETALKNNLDLQIAAERVEEARGYARVARSYLGPSIGVNGGTSPSPASKEDSTYSLGLGLNWELDRSVACAVRARQRAPSCSPPRMPSAA